MLNDELRAMGLNHATLAEQMVRSVQLFASLFEQNQVDLRLEVTDRQTCPKFHCDNVYVRMLVTYTGPTTEFIQRRQPDVIHHAPLHSLVFLKGHKHPTHQDRILHRSPEFFAGQKRLCMIINPSDSVAC